MKVMQAFRHVALVPMLCLGPLSLAQTVTVRVVNATNERPLQKQEVSVSFLYGKGEATPAKYDAHLILQTNENGEARFLLPEPVPQTFDVRVAIDWSRWHCGCSELAVTENVMQKGLVDYAAAANDVKRSSTLLKAVPGEIRFVVRPLSFFERLLGPLLRQ